ncbi:hypothetical protein [Roseivivax sediminis]|uniref:Uncharacterized protein n=1 Tax=Roseivivax sediminis TaxID=936889 RepID=A0A1I2EHK2_9RHOB|nr:hypothetical protein [Roseivivax sediminis]SFE91948.1 hypothetical protein SAMN04515678_12315 [Roseivivax sediminis]
MNARASVGKMQSETPSQTMARLASEVQSVKARYGCIKLAAALRGYKDFTFATASLYQTPPASGARERTIRCYYDPGETSADAASRASQAIRYAIAEEEKRRSAGSGTSEWHNLYQHARNTIRTRYKCNRPQ